jgi:hypothetical protein
MADLIEVPSGLEGVIAFDTTIAEPDKEGSALRYRGVDIEELVGRVRFEKVWGLLVDGSYEPGMPPAEPHPLAVRTGDPRADLQSALAMLAPEWGLRSLIDISDEQARQDLALEYGATDIVTPRGAEGGPTTTNASGRVHHRASRATTTRLLGRSLRHPPDRAPEPTAPIDDVAQVAAQVAVQLALVAADQHRERLPPALAKQGEQVLVGRSRQVT